MIRVLGIDPGIKLHGIARIVVHPSGRFEVEAYGHVDADTIAAELEGLGNVVAIELPERVYPKNGIQVADALALGRTLLATRASGELFHRYAIAALAEVRTMSPPEWRKAFTGSMAVDDRKVASACRLRAVKLPRTNNHARDAMGVAWAVGMKLLDERRRKR